MDDGYSVHIVDDVGAGANPADSPVPPDDTAVIDGGAAIRDEALDVFPHSVHIAGVDDAHERSAGFRAELLFGVADDIEGEGVRVEEGSVEIILDQRAQRGVIKGLEKRFLPPDGIVGVAPFRDIHNDAVDDGLAFLVFAFAARVPNPYEFPVFPLHTVFGGVGQGIGEAALAIRQGLRQVRRIDEFGHPAAAFGHELLFGIPEHPAQALVHVEQRIAFVIPVGLEAGGDGAVQEGYLAALLHKEALEVFVALPADLCREVFPFLHVCIRIGDMDERYFQLSIHELIGEGHALMGAEDIACFGLGGDPAASGDEA